MVEHQWIVSGNKHLSAMIHKNENLSTKTPVVICCHGFTGDKIGANQLTLHMAQAMAKAGVSVVRFDFSGSGESEGEFAEETKVSIWQEDLQNVIEWVKKRKEFSAAPLILYGHSMGGLTMLTTKTRWEQDVIGRISLASVIYPEENFRYILGEELWAQAVAGNDVANFFNKGFALHRGLFVKDLLEHHYEPLQDIVHYKQPLLIVHGTADAVVPLKGSEALYEIYQGEKTFHKLDGVDHLFTGNHTVLSRLIVQWLQELRNRKRS